MSVSRRKRSAPRRLARIFRSSELRISARLSSRAALQTRSVFEFCKSLRRQRNGETSEPASIHPTPDLSRVLHPVACAEPIFNTVSPPPDRASPHLGEFGHPVERHAFGRCNHRSREFQQIGRLFASH